ncbi:hypothetical protein TIFTF001_010322 [Ficus carica]|uniref:Uncharacterized protein n=1 Tax=Ficus carica TaxID=3494 RepID=A0AA87ZPX3_FICCA|nr:hypothetical protein TIFTF001_010322 [Ficus carica]
MKGWREGREVAEAAAAAAAAELGLRRESEEREENLLAATLNIMAWFWLFAASSSSSSHGKWWKGASRTTGKGIAAATWKISFSDGDDLRRELNIQKRLGDANSTKKSHSMKQVFDFDFNTSNTTNSEYSTIKNSNKESNGHKE